MTTVLQTLVAARDLISQPNRWTQHATARTPDGTAYLTLPDMFELVPRYEYACFCADGAVMRAAPNLENYIGAGMELTRTCVEMGCGAWNTHIGFNDFFGRTHEQVLDMFDRTIARLSANAAAA